MGGIRASDFSEKALLTGAAGMLKLCSPVFLRRKGLVPDMTIPWGSDRHGGSCHEQKTLGQGYILGTRYPLSKDPETVKHFRVWPRSPRGSHFADMPKAPSSLPCLVYIEYLTCDQQQGSLTPSLASCPLRCSLSCSCPLKSVYQSTGSCCPTLSTMVTRTWRDKTVQLYGILGNTLVYSSSIVKPTKRRPRYCTARMCLQFTLGTREYPDSLWVKAGQTQSLSCSSRGQTGVGIIRGIQNWHFLFCEIIQICRVFDDCTLAYRALATILLELICT